MAHADPATRTGRAHRERTPQGPIAAIPAAGSAGGVPQVVPTQIVDPGRIWRAREGCRLLPIEGLRRHPASASRSRALERTLVPIGLADSGHRSTSRTPGRYQERRPSGSRHADGRGKWLERELVGMTTRRNRPAADFQTRREQSFRAQSKTIARGCSRPHGTRADAGERRDAGRGDPSALRRRDKGARCGAQRLS